MADLTQVLNAIAQGDPHADEQLLPMVCFDLHRVAVRRLALLVNFPSDQPPPVSLTLQLDSPVEAGTSSACERLNRPALLVHSRDPQFVCCWFGQAIDLGDDSCDPAYWMLQKTALDTWFLCLRRVGHELAAYHLTAIKKHRFPVKLKRGRVGKEFTQWPRTITISPAG
jgi:hypothetical protein